MTDYNGFLDGLAGRLSNDGFSIQRGLRIDQYALELVATRVELSIMKGCNVHIIVATTMDMPTTEAILAFSEFAYQYCTRNLSTIVSTAIQKPVKGPLNTYVIPVTISNSFAEDIRDWISKKIPAKHFVPFNYPVLLAGSTGELYLCKKTPLLGALPWKMLRRFVEHQLRSPR